MSSDEDPAEDCYSDDSDYARLTSGSPSPEPVASSVHEAIDSVDPEKLRVVLHQLCTTNKAAEVIVTTKLLDALSNGTLRKAYEKCKHCKAEFNVLINEKGACVYHPGMSKPDLSYLDSENRRLMGSL